MAIRIITPPATEPLTLAELKTALRIDGTSDDTLLEALIVAAREFCEDYQKKKYITQTLELVLDYFKEIIEFNSCSPVQTVTSVKYYGTDGLENVVNSNIYLLDKDSFVARLLPKYAELWPSNQLQPANGVVIRFVAGYGTALDVPQTVKQAMILHIKLLYDDYKPEEFERIEKARNILLGIRRVVNI
jgi:uncharacterized phiE125 gp8 family phage protein